MHLTTFFENFHGSMFYVRRSVGAAALHAVGVSLHTIEEAIVLMQRLSYPTETVLSNNITRNIIVP